MASLVQKIHGLRHLDMEDLMPRICLVGDTDSGKRALVGRLSDIPIPGCAPCPTEINLSRSEPNKPWSCQITLSRKYLYREDRLSRPWIRKDQEDKLFRQLDKREDTQEAIKQAWLAIQNPDWPSSDLRPGQDWDAAAEGRTRFTTNLVRLDISAPGLPNLSFYDLPEVDDHVDLAEGLVQEYIAPGHCIVLLILRLSETAMDSSAARIVRSVPDALSRTLGVILHPGRNQDHEPLNLWRRILDDNLFELGHGCYVVRSPPDANVRSLLQSRDEEGRFFQSRPWTTLASWEQRLGACNLRMALYNLFLGQIRACMPLMREQIAERARRTHSELRTLPDVGSENPPYMLCKMMNDLKQHIQHQIDGGSTDYPMLKIWGWLVQDFREAIRITRPGVIYISADESARIRSSLGVSDGEMAPTRPRLKLRLRAQRANYFTSCFDRFSGPAKEFTWEKIRDMSSDFSPSGSAALIDPRAIEGMNRLSVAHWSELLAVFLGASHDMAMETVLQQAQRDFVRYGQTPLYSRLQSIITRYLERLRATHLAHVHEVYRIEYRKPFTMATASFAHATQEARSYLMTYRREALAKLYSHLCFGEASPDDSRYSAEIGELLDSRTDEPAPEIEIMANVIGYYSIASDRFVDSVCQSVYTHLLFKCRDDLVSVIEKELAIVDGDGLSRCRELMAENPERHQRRQFLTQEEHRLDVASKELAVIDDMLS